MAMKKFATQADPRLLEDVRQIAREEGRQFQALVEEAFQDLVSKRRGAAPRKHVLEAYEASVAEYTALYERLAK